MRRLGIHSFVWTGGQTQDGLEMALEKSAEHGYRMIEFAYLRPEKFDLDRLSKKAQELDIEIVVTMGLPAEADVSSEDAAAVARGKAILSDAVKAVRDIGGIRLGGILYSMHGKYDRMPTERGWMNSAEAIAETADVAKDCGVEIVLEVVNRFESNLLNTTAQGLKFIEDTGRDDVYLHLDSFHMNIEEADPAGAIRLAGDKLTYYHIGENYRGYLGTGTVDFDAIFAALRRHRLRPRHRLRELLERDRRRGTVAGLRHLARHLDRQRSAGGPCEDLHRAEMGRGEAPPRHERTGLTAARPQNLRQEPFGRERPMSDFASLSSSPRRVRQANVVAALQAIFAQGRLSRAELARQLGLNRSSSGNIITELTTNGLVREVADGGTETDPGRPTGDPSGTRSGGRLLRRRRDRRGAHHRASHRPRAPT